MRMTRPKLLPWSSNLDKNLSSSMLTRRRKRKPPRRRLLKRRKKRNLPPKYQPLMLTAIQSSRSLDQRPSPKRSIPRSPMRKSFPLTKNWKISRSSQAKLLTTEPFRKSTLSSRTKSLKNLSSLSPSTTKIPMLSKSFQLSLLMSPLTQEKNQRSQLDRLGRSPNLKLPFASAP